MRKIVLLISLFMILFISPAFSRGEIYFGIDFPLEYDFPSRDTSINYKNFNTDETKYVENVRYLGVGANITYFPYAEIKLGLNASYKMMMPIGYSLASYDGSGSTDHTYVNYRYTAKHSIDLGLSYYWMMGSTFGLYIDAGAAIAVHTIPYENRKNTRVEIDYLSFAEYGIYENIGLVLHHDPSSTYFKIGMRFVEILSNQHFGFTGQIVLSGGYRFSY